MEDELAALRARIERLEQRADHVLDLADRIDADASSARDLMDDFVMRLLLWMGGDAYRDRLLRILDRLAEKESAWIEEEGKSKVDQMRLLYWRELLQKREPWDFPPDGWMAFGEP